MKTIQFTILTFAFVFTNSLFAQLADSSKTTPVQIAFAYPVSSNGPQAKYISNKFSLNVLYGVNGGLDGLEIGGLVNITKGAVKGCQIAGITNLTDSTVTGIQISGITNTTTDSLFGIQIAGINNIVTKNTIGAQISSINNVSNNQLIGAQISGISNIASNHVTGTQISGISNVLNGSLTGAQISGIHNLATQNITGGQIGLINMALDTIKGAQIGLINNAKTLHGAQIGLINLADSSSGVSIGLVNIVKTGFHAIELSSNEVLYANAAVKLGTEHFYNIYQFGFQPGNNNVFGFGTGFGSRVNINKTFSVSADITFNHINESSTFTWKMNSLTKTDLTLDIHLNKNITFTFGPSFNALLSDLGYSKTGQFTSQIAKNPFYTEKLDDYQLQLWIGAKGGIQIRF